MSVDDTAAARSPRHDDLVDRLTQGRHRVVVGGPEPSAAELGRRLGELGYAFVKFPDTRGGTDLGVRVDPAATDTSGANFGDGSGQVHIEGTLTIDYVPARLVADIDIATLSGEGHLVRGAPEAA